MPCSSLHGGSQRTQRWRCLVLRAVRVWRTGGEGAGHSGPWATVCLPCDTQDRLSPGRRRGHTVPGGEPAPRRRLTSSGCRIRFRRRSGPQRACTPILRFQAPSSRNFNKFQPEMCPGPSGALTWHAKNVDVAVTALFASPLSAAMPSIQYSEKYYDDVYEYRRVVSGSPRRRLCCSAGGRTAQ